MPLSAALIGCGRMGAFSLPETITRLPPGFVPLSHADAMVSLPEIELVAACDPDPDRLRQVRETYHVRRLYGDYKTLIDEVKPDVVSIATRTQGRCDVISYAAEHCVAGIHAEKPLGRNLTESRRAIDSVRRHGVSLTFGTYRRFHDAYRQARELLDSGDFGELLHIVVEHGRTSLMWDHPHSVDLLLFFARSVNVDYVQSTCLVTREAMSGSVLDDDPIVESAVIKFANGAVGLISSAPGMNTRVICTQGTIVIAGNGSRLETFQRRHAEECYFLNSSRLDPEPTLSGTQRAFRELVKAVREGQPPSISAEEIIFGQRLLGAIAISSLRNGERVAPSEVDDAFTITGRVVVQGRVCYA